jgi:hypothetical protein
MNNYGPSRNDPAGHSRSESEEVTHLVLFLKADLPEHRRNRKRDIAIVFENLHVYLDAIKPYQEDKFSISFEPPFQEEEPNAEPTEFQASN